MSDAAINKTESIKRIDTDNIELPLDAFIRNININKGIPHGVFLGAGASHSSGIPTASLCIWEWKREIFLTNNPGLKEQFSELSLKSVRDHIQDWLDMQREYPICDAPDEYQFYIEKCFPISDSRRSYFQEHVNKAEPFIGYKLLCLLAENHLFNTVFSTNFDGLASKAAANFKITPIEIGLDSQARLSRPLNRDEILCICMHGDYRYDQLKNTTAELKSQESRLREKLIEFAKDSPLIISGYSGRDDSIMDAMMAAYSQEGKGSLYWCGREGGEVPERVKRLIIQARSKGRTAYYIRTTSFDDLMERLSFHCLEGSALDTATKLISDLSSKKENTRSAFSLINEKSVSVIKSNAFPLEVPSEIFQCELKTWPSTGRWKWVEEKIKGKDIVAAPFKEKLLFWGDIDDVKSLFVGNVNSPIERTPVTGKDLRREDGAIVSLIRQAIVRSLGALSGLPNDGKKEIWLSNGQNGFVYEGIRYEYHQSVLVSIKSISSRSYVILMPSIRIIDAKGNVAPAAIAKIKKNTLLSGQYNEKFNDSINEWRKKIFSCPDSWIQFEFPVSSASPFIFRIKKSPIFAQIDSRNRNARIISIDNQIKHLVEHKGLEVEEPKLIFSNLAADGTVRDIHPIRGILNARPFDHILTVSGLMPKVKIGIICPLGESKNFSTKLQAIKSRHHAKQREKDYLFDYPGFDVAYGIPLDLPSHGDSAWNECHWPKSSDNKTASLEAAQNIIKSLDEMYATSRPSVTIIFIPKKWKNFRGFKSEIEYFDLHDFIKAYAVQKGIATQFIEEDTFSNPSPCRVWWWLSLALYTKSMRTPWVLDGMNKDTAYVGLGFSIDHTAPRGQKVTLGCSHIYNHQGQGLQYRLTKLEKPIIRGKNAFMSLEDARRLGEKIRELFFEGRKCLPSRVIIHKNTPFLKDEQTGLLEGLSGVDDVEMIQISIDHSLRYVSSFIGREGIKIGMFPVKRGTAIRLDDFSAVAWVHGSTQLMSDGRTYYQGKRRIPAPIQIKKFTGHSDIEIIVREILGLSKMDWNTFDLYNQLPATIKSSSQIARIGSLLERFDSISYDYRLFM